MSARPVTQKDGDQNHSSGGGRWGQRGISVIGKTERTRRCPLWAAGIGCSLRLLLPPRNCLKRAELLHKGHFLNPTEKVAEASSLTSSI